MNRICSILALLLCLASARADNASDRATSLKQLRTLGTLFHSFLASHDGRFPKTLNELIASQKSPDPSLLIAPMATDKTKPSYELVLPADAERISQVINPAATVIVRSRFKFADGHLPVLFADGHIEVIKPAR